MIGCYPDYDVLDALGTWDEATKRVVLARLEPPGPLRFFPTDEEPALRALCDTALAQDREPRVPVAEMVDAELADGRLDGYQYADLPDDRDTWRLVLRGVEVRADCMALRVEIDQSTGLARGVVYTTEVGGAQRLQRARFVAIAGYSIETPRLLLASTSARFQDVLTIQRFAHLIGGARMGSSPESSVVDSSQRSWAVGNLFIADGSVLAPLPGR